MDYQVHDFLYRIKLKKKIKKNIHLKLKISKKKSKLTIFQLDEFAMVGIHQDQFLKKMKWEVVVQGFGILLEIKKEVKYGKAK